MASDRPPLTYHVASPPEPSEEQREFRLVPPPTDNVAVTDLVENPFGTKRSMVFAGATGTGVTQNSTDTAQGGVILGGSPVNRLTLHGFVGRDENGRLAPSATIHVRFLGDYAAGYALGALVRYKTEGFTEAGGEAEIGITGGFHRGGFHLDANLVGGLGVEESEMGEVDAEGRLRLGYDVIRFVRLGAVGQVRSRLAGDRALAGGHTWDAMGGPAISAWHNRFLLCLNGGPSTVGVANGLGAYGMVTLAAVSDL